MISANEAKQYIKAFEPSERAKKEVLDVIERQIKNGERHPRAYTTSFCRDYAKKEIPTITIELPMEEIELLESLGVIQREEENEVYD